MPQPPIIFGVRLVERREAQRRRGGLRNPTDARRARLARRTRTPFSSRHADEPSQGSSQGCLASTLAPPGAPFSLSRETENGIGSSAPSVKRIIRHVFAMKCAARSTTRIVASAIRF